MIISVVNEFRPYGNCKTGKERHVVGICIHSYRLMFLAEDDCKKPVWILAEDVKVVSGFIPPWWISTDESSNHGRIAIFIGYDKLVTDFDYRNRISEDRVCGSGDFRDEIAKVMEFENYERQK